MTRQRIGLHPADNKEKLSLIDKFWAWTGFSRDLHLFGPSMKSKGRKVERQKTKRRTCDKWQVEKKSAPKQEVRNVACTCATDARLRSNRCLQMTIPSVLQANPLLSNRSFACFDFRFDKTKYVNRKCSTPTTGSFVHLMFCGDRFRDVSLAAPSNRSFVFD